MQLCQMLPSAKTGAQKKQQEERGTGNKSLINCLLYCNQHRHAASSGSDLATFHRLRGEMGDRTRAPLNIHNIPPRQCVCMCVSVCEYASDCVCVCVRLSVRVRICVCICEREGGREEVHIYRKRD